MAAVELILLQRVEKLGQMGDVVQVKPGYRPQLPAAAEEGAARQQGRTSRVSRPQRAQLEAQNLKRREEAERVAERVDGLSVVVIRQAGDSGSLYGSVSGARHRRRRDRRRPRRSTASRSCSSIRSRRWACARCAWCCIPEVSITVTVNVARSPEEAEKQAARRGGGPCGRGRSRRAAADIFGTRAPRFG